MSADLGNPQKMPPGTSPLGKKIYAWIFLVAACLSSLSVALEKAKVIPTGVLGACRAFHICSPTPLKPLSPLATDWLPAGSTWTSASHDALEKDRLENPDYDITFIQGKEYNSCDDEVIKVDCMYRYEGTFSGTQKWHGLLEGIGL